jgi:hypothetical protein
MLWGEIVEMDLRDGVIGRVVDGAFEIPHRRWKPATPGAKALGWIR